MVNQLNITDEERKRIQAEIDSFFLFTEDVIENPSLLNDIPNDADIEAIPVARREPGRTYDIETPRTVATVNPPVSGSARPSIARKGQRKHA